MENVLPTADATVARRPDAEAVRAIIEADEVILGFHRRYEEMEAARVARARVLRDKVAAELKACQKEARVINARVRVKQKSLNSLNKRCLKHPMRNSTKKRIEQRKLLIQAREKTKFLRAARIEFGERMKEL